MAGLMGVVGVAVASGGGARPCCWGGLGGVDVVGGGVWVHEEFVVGDVPGVGAGEAECDAVAGA
ncbi:Uncharacterised protein [Dermatophilus congolensis]|uniref:Uncharacterized protein n=1 Tax=Dermatophilus congolensis TaxID=1863 RepID=A0AA46BLB4_9MICO|nr:Uncharacterised protein [Dermatophilus congolensis]